MPGLEQIGSQIAAQRKARKWRQVDLAAKAGVSRATIDALENGRAGELGYAKLARILAALGLELRLGPVASRRPTLEELIDERSDERAGKHLNSHYERTGTLSQRLKRMADVLAETAKDIES